MEEGGVRVFLALEHKIIAAQKNNEAKVGRLTNNVDIICFEKSLKTRKNFCQWNKTLEKLPIFARYQ